MWPASTWGYINELRTRERITMVEGGGRRRQADPLLDALAVASERDALGDVHGEADGEHSSEVQ